MIPQNMFVTPRPMAMPAAERDELHARIVLFAQEPQARLIRLAQAALDGQTRLEEFIDQQEGLLTDLWQQLGDRDERIKTQRRGLESAYWMIARLLDRELPEEVRVQLKSEQTAIGRHLGKERVA